MRTALVFAWQGFSTCIHFLEVATLKVFTSIFVPEGMHTTFGDVEEGFRRDLVLSTEDELAEVSRRHVMNLHIDKEVRNQTGGRGMSIQPGRPMLVVLRDTLQKLECSPRAETRDVTDLKRILRRRISEIELAQDKQTTILAGN